MLTTHHVLLHQRAMPAALANEGSKMPDQRWMGHHPVTGFSVQEEMADTAVALLWRSQASKCGFISSVLMYEVHELRSVTHTAGGVGEGSEKLGRPFPCSHT